MSDDAGLDATRLDDDAREFAARLFDAARAGDAAFVLSAVDQGVPANLADGDRNSLLMLAAYHGRDELVAGLAIRGADVNQANDRGQTPLAGAVFKQHTGVIHTLISHGADPDAGTPSARETAQLFGVEEMLTGESNGG